MSIAGKLTWYKHKEIQSLIIFVQGAIEEQGGQNVSKLETKSIQLPSLHGFGGGVGRWFFMPAWLKCLQIGDKLEGPPRVWRWLLMAASLIEPCRRHGQGGAGGEGQPAEPLTYPIYPSTQ